MFHIRDSRAKKAGSTIAVCPACGKMEKIQMFEVYDSLHLICVPVGSFLQDYFAVCPACSSVFAVDQSAYVALKGGNANFINSDHMQIIVNGGTSQAGK